MGRFFQHRTSQALTTWVSCAFHTVISDSTPYPKCNLFVSAGRYLLLPTRFTCPLVFYKASYRPPRDLRMPYNTTAIPPRKEVTGQTQLPRECYEPVSLLRTVADPGPVTRVKKIIAVDPDITVCSNNAAFVITLATVSWLLLFHTFAWTGVATNTTTRRCLCSTSPAKLRT